VPCRYLAHFANVAAKRAEEEELAARAATGDVKAKAELKRLQGADKVLQD